MSYRTRLQRLQESRAKKKVRVERIYDKRIESLEAREKKLDEAKKKVISNRWHSLEKIDNYYDPKIYRSRFRR